MSDAFDDYAVCYRWEWFRRDDWRGSFRERKRHSAGAFAELVRDRGLSGVPVLDCSCGLGQKTIVMREAGLRVEGSDGCPAAVDYARSFAAEESHADIPYFVSTWADLGSQHPACYAAVFNDALSWVHDDADMAAALRGIHDCLRPGGFLVYMGAIPGTDEDEAGVLGREWAARTAGGRWQLGFRAHHDGVSAQEVIGQELGQDFIDERHLIVVDDHGDRRLEAWSVRCAVRWNWPRIEPVLRRAGFAAFAAHPFTATGGRPHHLVVARRD